MQLFLTLEEALEAIDSFKGEPEDFLLPISDEMNNAINMAITTDRVPSKEWEPNGFEQRDGFRTYRYQKST